MRWRSWSWSLKPRLGDPWTNSDLKQKHSHSEMLRGFAVLHVFVFGITRSILLRICRKWKGIKSLVYFEPSLSQACWKRRPSGFGVLCLEMEQTNPRLWIGSCLMSFQLPEQERYWMGFLGPGAFLTLQACFFYNNT